jgi:hypothetical protein
LSSSSAPRDTYRAPGSSPARISTSPSRRRPGTTCTGSSRPAAFAMKTSEWLPSVTTAVSGTLMPFALGSACGTTSTKALGRSLRSWLSMRTRTSTVRRRASMTSLTWSTLPSRSMPPTCVRTFTGLPSTMSPTSLSGMSAITSTSSRSEMRISAFSRSGVTSWLE